jgi:DNA polymerase IV
MRKIIHIDMDAFFASVEQRDNPEWQGKPIAVGYAGERGVVAAASYEARKYGVFSAMSSKVALRKCPHLLFVRPRFDAYSQVSRQIREIFYEYTDLVEPLSLDEAYLDVTENKIGMPSATLIAQAIKKKIFAETQLTASAGISINKFLAKIASDYKKPNGLYVILPEQAEAFVETLPIHKIHGIGKVTAQKMEKLGIRTGGDLKTWEKMALIQQFGKVGQWYYDIARAIDNRAVNPHRIRKSLGTENTFAYDLSTRAEMQVELAKLAESLLKSLQQRKIFGRTLTLKVKFADFTTITRSRTISYLIDSQAIMQKIYDELLQTFDAENAQVRLLGLQISNLDNEEIDPKIGVQLTLDF